MIKISRIDGTEKVKCDVCRKTIEDEKFRTVFVHVTDFQDRYVQKAVSNCEKDIDVCNDCVQHLNFREYKGD